MMQKRKIEEFVGWAKRQKLASALLPWIPPTINDYLGQPSIEIAFVVTQQHHGAATATPEATLVVGSAGYWQDPVPVLPASSPSCIRHAEGRRLSMTATRTDATTS